MDTNISLSEEFEFNHSTIKKILETYSKFQQDHEALLSFVQAPDEYMKDALGQEEMGAGLHFHLYHESVAYPQDSAPPTNQLVFRSEINVPSDLIPDIVASLRKSKIEDLARGGGVYCSGCKKCAVAVVVGIDKPRIDDTE